MLASSTEQMRVLELMQLQNDSGPCLEASKTGESVFVEHVGEHVNEWPAFTLEALAQGITAAYAIPLRLRDTTIGALNLFCTDGRALSPDSLRIGHVLASMATIGITNHRAVRKHEVVTEQLQGALDSRIVIEQAKGIAAESLGVDMADAFELLRATARRSNRSISDVATEIIRDRPTRMQLLASAGS